MNKKTLTLLLVISHLLCILLGYCIAMMGPAAEEAAPPAEESTIGTETTQATENPTEAVTEAAATEEAAEETEPVTEPRETTPVYTQPPATQPPVAEPPAPDVGEGIGGKYETDIDYA